MKKTSRALNVLNPPGVAIQDEVVHMGTLTIRVDCLIEYVEHLPLIQLSTSTVFV